jgi:hypothetical protein
MGGVGIMKKTVKEHIDEVTVNYPNSKEVLLWAYWDKKDFGNDLSNEEWETLCNHDFDWSDINAQIDSVIDEIMLERPEPQEEINDTELWEE